MKKKILSVLLVYFTVMQLLSVPVSASECVNRYDDVCASFDALAASKPVYALLYNTKEYDMKAGASQEAETVCTLTAGQQITLTEMIINDTGIWYKAKTALEGWEYEGYVESAYIISGDADFNAWLDLSIPSYLKVSLYNGSSAYDTYIENNFPSSYWEDLKNLKAAHPNWQFVPQYTGLDWDTVIDNEMYPSRNLIYITAKDSWKSKAEGDYDASTGTYIGKSGPNWVQASREAVEYFMDPRNFLTETAIFQFEQLTYNTSYHSEEGVELVLEGTWMSHQALEDNPSLTYARAFMEIGKNYGVSPFHLASRVRQEQGAMGSSPLISGTVSGYEGYYNYFNIGASGNTTSEVITSGLKKAVAMGWSTRYKSIEGGAKSVAGSYVSKGQDTLYLQKFDVDDSYNGLYYHQYMQNVQAPSSESLSVYWAYYEGGSLDNTIVFKIPVYENMPNAEVSYVGDINSELKTFSLNKTEGGVYYLSGEVVIVEWVDGVSTVPRETPKMYLVSTDGEEKIEAFVTATGTNTYYFDRVIEGLSSDKEYSFYIESASQNNVSSNKAMYVNFVNSAVPSSGFLGYIGNSRVKYYSDSSNRLVIRQLEPDYEGNINSELYSFSLNQTSQGAYYLSGSIVVVEWINGVSTVPKETPSMIFKSTDGSEQIEAFVTPTGTNTYYFDRFIEGLDSSKEYTFEITLTEENNISMYKSMNVSLATSPKMETEKVLGLINKNTIQYRMGSNGEMVITSVDGYYGNINSELKETVLTVGEAGNFISGKIIIVEWVNGCSTVPDCTPVMHFNSTDKTESLPVFVTPTGTNTYYFDRCIEYLDTGKEYIFTVESGDDKNISDTKKMTVTTACMDSKEGLLWTYNNQSVYYKTDALTGELRIYAVNN